MTVSSLLAAATLSGWWIQEPVEVEQQQECCYEREAIIFNDGEDEAIYIVDKQTRRVIFKIYREEKDNE